MRGKAQTLNRILSYNQCFLIPEVSNILGNEILFLINEAFL